MTWWLFRSSRLSSEKASVGGLETSVDWLRVGNWQTDADLAMHVDFSISVGDETFALRMTYPSVFPDTPPMIYTEDKSRVSWHQYGAEGELCLEHRPDNWQTSVTGADMIASCQRLLSEERPEQGEVIHARSAHIASLGRDMRSKYCRLLLTENDLKALNGLPSCTSETLLLRDRKAPSNIVSSIVHIGEKDNPIWVSDLVLPAGELDHTAFAVRAPGAGQLGDLNAKEFEAVLVAMGLIDLRDLLLHSDDYHHLLIGDGNDWELLWIYGEQAERKTIGYTTLQLPADKQRLPDAFTSLAIRKVGIVGCGSIGSKIAASLCRSGVSDFFLIDEDIFLPGNIVRNELDLDSSGTHKVKALRDRLLRINPSVDVKTLQITLGGQESAKSIGLRPYSRTV